MASDQPLNFVKVGVSTTYGAGAEGNYNLVWWDSTTYSDPADDPNVEIVRVTALATDTLTVVRAQEGTAATTKNTAVVTYKMFLGPTAKTIDGVDTSQRINAATHGFVVGDVLRHNGTNYVKALADSDANAEVIGMVSSVSSDGNYFDLATIGRITGLSGLTAGTAYFLSDTVAGTITATATTTEGSIIKPVLISDSTTSGYLYNMRGNEIVAGSVSFYKSFDNTDLIAGVLSLNHGLGHKFAIVQIYDDSDKLVLADDITLVDDNNLTVDLSSYGAISPTWRVVILDTGTTTALTNSDTLTFTSASPEYAVGVVTQTHDLGNQFPQVQVYNNSNQLVQPDNITATSTTVTTIDLTSFHPITGTWTSVAQL
jgi:hypothetical protein